MNSDNEPKLMINMFAAGETSTIYLRGVFNFQAFHAFKGAYMSQLRDAKINCVVVDCEHVNYIDSTALEMLIVLRERVQSAGKSLILSRPSRFVERVFKISKFYDLFVIK